MSSFVCTNHHYVQCRCVYSSIKHLHSRIKVGGWGLKLYCYHGGTVSYMVVQVLLVHKFIMRIASIHVDPYNFGCESNRGEQIIPG